jgi:hypothetical protein
VHPQEIDYNIETLFELIDASGLDFVGFSNPGFWQIDRLLGKAPELMERTQGLGDCPRGSGKANRASYRLIELLDPEVTHYEFFLSCPPLPKADWSADDAILAAIPERNPCIDGFPSQCVFNYDYQIVNLSPLELEFLQKCDGQSTVGGILAGLQLGLDAVRVLLKQQLILLTPS